MPYKTDIHDNIQYNTTVNIAQMVSLKFPVTITTRHTENAIVSVFILQINGLSRHPTLY